MFSQDEQFRRHRLTKPLAGIISSHGRSQGSVGLSCSTDAASKREGHHPSMRA